MKRKLKHIKPEVDKSYEMSYHDTQGNSTGVTTAKLLEFKHDGRLGHYKFEYLDGEKRKQVTPNKGTNYFWLPDFVVRDHLNFKEL